MNQWENLERSEKTGPPDFTQYFCTHKLDDMHTNMVAFVLKDLGLGIIIIIIIKMVYSKYSKIAP